MDAPVFDFSEDLTGKRVILRASLNVPLEHGSVTNVFRIEEALPTVEQLAKKGARTVIVAHIGRSGTETLRPVWEEMKKHTSVAIRFCEDTTGARARDAAGALRNGEALLLENVRRNRGETEDDDGFSEALASFGDMFINDAFADSHREHASIVGVPRHLPGFLGPLFKKELDGIAPARLPARPSLAIVGGAKFVTKEPLLHHLAAHYEDVFIGGALANDFFKAQGHPVGRSLVSMSADVSALLGNKRVHVPEYIVVERAGDAEEVHVSEVLEDDFIYDIAERSLAALEPLIEKARFILWNGPMGNFEKGYAQGTEFLAERIAEAPGDSVVGGGDTIAAIEALDLRERFSYVSTSGGAMLRFIADGTLPGIEALKRQ